MLKRKQQDALTAKDSFLSTLDGIRRNIQLKISGLSQRKDAETNTMRLCYDKILLRQPTLSFTYLRSGFSVDTIPNVSEDEFEEVIYGSKVGPSSGANGNLLKHISDASREEQGLKRPTFSVQFSDNVVRISTDDSGVEICGISLISKFNAVTRVTTRLLDMSQDKRQAIYRIEASSKGTYSLYCCYILKKFSEQEDSELYRRISLYEEMSIYLASIDF